MSGSKGKHPGRYGGPGSSNGGPGSSHGGPGSSDDDRWLAALAGRSDAGTSPATDLEAAMLRAALRRTAAAPALSPQRQQQLLTALDAIPGKGWRCSSCARRWQMITSWLRQALQHQRPRKAAVPLLAGAALAALLAGLLVNVRPLLPAPAAADDPVLRGAGSLDVQVLRVDQPQARRDSLAAELAAQGAGVRRYTRLGRFGLDAQWNGSPLPPAAAAALKAAGLVPPADGIVRVEFAAATP